jgi:hypothetical protein
MKMLNGCHGSGERPKDTFRSQNAVICMKLDPYVLVRYFGIFIVALGLHLLPRADAATS